MSCPDEQALKAALAAGQEQAFARLYDLYGRQLYAVARRFTGRASDAEDIVQETFLAMVRFHHNFMTVQDLPAYLFTTLRRTAARWRSSADRERLVIHQLAAQTEAHPRPADGLTDDRLDRALGQLPAEQREVVSLRIDGGLTFAQIGEVLGVSLNTAASRYRYALEKLEAALKPAGNLS